MAEVYFHCCDDQRVLLDRRATEVEDGEVATGAERGAFQLMDEFSGLMLNPFVNGRGYAPVGGGASGFPSMR